MTTLQPMDVKMTTNSPSTVQSEPGSAAPPVEADTSLPTQDVGDTEDASQADPSAAPPEAKAETRESLLEVVQKAIEPKGDDDEDGLKEVDKEGASPAPDSAEDGKPLGDITQEELDAYRPRTKKRIESLLAAQRELRAEIEPLRVRAKTTEDLQSFLKTADIGQEDFGLVLDLAAAMRRGDFKAFLEGVTPYVQLAQESLGVVLPVDLKAAVDQGHMSEDAARYTAQQRSMRQLAEAKAQRFEQTQEEGQRAKVVETFTKNIETAVSIWEKGIRKADPDYAQKQPVVMDLLHAVVQERGPPKSADDAVAIAEAAYERANKMLQRFAPRPSATARSPSSIGTRVNGARAEPKSLLEAAQMALDRTRS